MARLVLILIMIGVIAGVVMAQEGVTRPDPACDIDNVELARANLNAVQDAIEADDLEAAVEALQNLDADVQGMLLHCDRSPEGVMRAALQALYNNDIEPFQASICIADREFFDPLLVEDLQAAADLSGLQLIVGQIEPDLVHVQGSGYVGVSLDGEYEALTGEEWFNNGITMILEDGEWRICASARARVITIEFDMAGITERYDELPQTVNDDGMPVLGEDGDVTVMLFTSYGCSACGVWHEEWMGQLVDRVRAGEVQLMIVPLQSGSIPNAQGALRTAYCAGEQGMYFEMHDALFLLQGLQGNAAFIPIWLDHAVETLGLDSGAIAECMNSADTASWISAVNSIAVNAGINSTPTLLVNDVPVRQNELFDAIDAALSE